jgi:hypothetical protein
MESLMAIFGEVGFEAKRAQMREALKERGGEEGDFGVKES